MQANTAASTAAQFGTSLNFPNSAINYLHVQQQQQQQQSILNPVQLNINTSILQQQQQQQQQTSPPQKQQKDTTFTKVFVGGLPYHTTDETLKSFFQKFGNIEEAVVITDRTTGKSRGYGFVTMETKEAAEAAVLDPNPVIDGRKANVNLAYLGVKSRVIAPNIIPLTIRYQLPPSSATTTYGFHPFYYHPSATTSNTNGNHTQPGYLAASNLLLTPQNTTHVANSISPLTNMTNNSNFFDLTSAYGAHMVALNNSNRTSPFENGNHLTATVNSSSPYSQFSTTLTSSNQQAVAAAAINSMFANQSNAGYFALPQHLTSAFQSQLQDRL